MSPKFKNPRAKHNFQGRTCSITGVGSYLPAKILTNADLEKMVETSDEWITTRTGIKARRQAAKDEFTSDMAAHAARRAMKMAGVTADQIDLIIVATITPDMPFPATACLVQQKIGARRAAAFDVEAACSGFIYALEIGQQFIMSRTYDTVLVVGAEKLSSITDWTDRNTCVLFGDGAGAAILQSRPDSHGLLTAVMGADGDEKRPDPHARRRQPLSGLGGFGRARNFTTCAWTAARRSRTPSRRCTTRHRRRCAVVNWTFRKSNASFPIRRTAGSLTRWASAWAPPRNNCSSIWTITATRRRPRWPLRWMKPSLRAKSSGAI